MLFETAAHARTPLHLAGSVTGLVGLHVSCFPSGKMKWFGGDKGKDVKCLKLPEGIVSITFPFPYLLIVKSLISNEVKLFPMT